jgi:hypothetical protein
MSWFSKDLTAKSRKDLGTRFIPFCASISSQDPSIRSYALRYLVILHRDVLKTFCNILHVSFNDFEDLFLRFCWYLVTRLRMQKSSVKIVLISIIIKCRNLSLWEFLGKFFKDLTRMRIFEKFVRHLQAISIESWLCWR